MKVRITFRSEIFIEGENLEDITKKWESVPLFSKDALEHSAEFIEVCSTDMIEND